MSSAIDDGYARYRAQVEAEAAGAAGVPERDAVRHARFELHVNGPRNRTLEAELTETFGTVTRVPVDRVRGPNIDDDAATMYVWDVEDPSTVAHLAKNMNVRAAELTEQDAYLVWYAVTGFPMTYEAGN